MKKMIISGLVLMILLCVSIAALAQDSKELPPPPPPVVPVPTMPAPTIPVPTIPVPTMPAPTIPAPTMMPTPIVITPNAEIPELDPVYQDPIILDDENKLGALIDELNPEHIVTGNCVDLEGNQKCEDFQCDISGDGSFNCQIPDIPELNVTGTSYDRDIEVTILFIGDEPILLSPNSAYLSIDDYNTPLGLGASIMNLGICVE